MPTDWRTDEMTIAERAAVLRSEMVRTDAKTRGTLVDTFTAFGNVCAAAEKWRADVLKQYLIDTLAAVGGFAGIAASDDFLSLVPREARLKVRKLEAKGDELRAENARLREALAPFAERASLEEFARQVDQGLEQPDAIDGGIKLSAWIEAQRALAATPATAEWLAAHDADVAARALAQEASRHDHELTAEDFEPLPEVPR